MRITKTSKVAAVIVGLALVAAACGDDKAKTADTTAATLLVFVILTWLVLLVETEGG